MNPPKLLPILVLVLFAGRASAQLIEIKGTVYDISQQYPMQGVSVMSTSGLGTMTDSVGRYHILVPAGDSISFSYLGRGTAKYPVKDLPHGYPFDMSLQVAVDSLPTAFVRSHNYRLDSLENRKEYEKVFDYHSSYLHNMKMDRRAGFGMGFDLNMLLDGKANKRMEALQKRLVEEEQDKYVDHRWNTAIVKRVTGLEPPALDTFMRQYRPSYEFIQSCQTEYEYYKFIKEWGKFFQDDWKVAHKEGGDSIRPAAGDTLTGRKG